MKGPINLSGDLWVAGRACPLVKRRIRHLRRGKDNGGSIAYREKSMNNFVARLRALEARR